MSRLSPPPARTPLPLVARAHLHPHRRSEVRFEAPPIAIYLVRSTTVFARAINLHSMCHLAATLSHSPTVREGTPPLVNGRPSVGARPGAPMIQARPTSPPAPGDAPPPVDGQLRGRPSTGSASPANITLTRGPPPGAPGPAVAVSGSPGGPRSPMATMGARPPGAPPPTNRPLQASGPSAPSTPPPVRGPPPPSGPPPSYTPPPRSTPPPPADIPPPSRPPAMAVDEVDDTEFQ